MNRSLIVTLSAVLCLLGCQSSDSEQFWRGLPAGGADEAEYYDTLAEMTAAADAVVLAHLSDFGTVRTIQGDAAEDQVRMVSGDLVIDEVVSGTEYPSPVPLEFVLVEQGEPWPDTLAAMRESFPTGGMLVFLREKQDGSGQFRIVNSDGLIVDSGDGLTAPLADEALDEGRFAPEVEGHESLAELAESLPVG